jgi:hypothetical protein
VRAEAAIEKPSDRVSIARAVADAVHRVPGVATLSPGQFAEFATHGPGERIEGVLVTRGHEHLRVEVHLTAHYSSKLNIPSLARQVRSAALRAVDGADARKTRIDIVVDDLRFSE